MVFKIVALLLNLYVHVHSSVLPFNHLLTLINTVPREKLPFQRRQLRGIDCVSVPPNMILRSFWLVYEMEMVRYGWPSVSFLSFGPENPPPPSIFWGTPPPNLIGYRNDDQKIWPYGLPTWPHGWKMDQRYPRASILSFGFWILQ